MLQITTNEIVLCVLAALAGFGVMMFVLMQRRKLVAIRKRAHVVASKAKEEGFDLLAELCESVATGDIKELNEEIEKLHTMFMTPGVLMTHLDKLFTVQLTKRLKDAAKRQEILDAVDATRAEAERAKQTLLDTAKREEALKAVATTPAATE